MSNGIFFKKTHKLWLWKAVDNTTGQLLDWQVGKRDVKTLTPLLDRIEARFAPNPYITDDWGPYSQVIPETQLVQNKALTSRIESHNSNTRHWFKRFTRKSKVVSKSISMVELTLKLDAFQELIWNF